MTVEIKAKAVRAEVDAPSSEANILAEAAMRIMREDVFVRSISNLRTHTLEQLAGVNPLDSDVIMQLQATVRAIDGLSGELVKFAHGATRAPRKVI